jgi:hypothetical protein
MDSSIIAGLPDVTYLTPFALPVMVVGRPGAEVCWRRVLLLTRVHS